MNKKGFKSVAKLTVLAALLILAMGLSGVFAACTKSATVALDVTEKTMYVADTFKLTATASEEDADIEWASDNTAVATVKRGTVTAVAAGEAVITATLDNGAYATCAITVLDRTVSISETEKTIEWEQLGEDKTITLTATASDGGEVSWETSDPSIATVANGVVTFLQPEASVAEVTITAKRGAASAECVITVNSTSIPEDYYRLTKETNANVVANPGIWYYHADGSEGGDYGFAKAPAYGNGGLTAELNIFPSLADKKYFRFRYQPDFAEGTKYTVKFTLTVNIDGEVGIGTHSSYGGITNYKVKADTAADMVYCGTVNSSEPFHININKVTGTVSGNVSFVITDLTVKQYEEGDEDTGDKNLYDLVRGDAATTCNNAGKWYYMINPVNATSDYTEASYDNGVITLALAQTLIGTDHQLRIRPDFAAGTKVTAKFTVKLSAPGEVAYGLNNVTQREKIVFGSGDGETAAGTEVTVTAVFTVSDSVPFVIWVTPAEGAGALTMTVTAVEFAEKLPDTYTVTFDSKGGSRVEAASVTEGGSVTVPAEPTFAGHKFDGWYVAEDCSGNKVTFPFTPAANVTLYAKWLNYYTVTFDAKGGDAVEAISGILEGTSVSLPAAEREGFVFLGWFENENDAEKVNATYSPAANVTLYAKWVEATVPTYTVTYNTMGGNALAAEAVPEGESVTLPAAPVYEGHVFDGWYAAEDYSGEKLEGTFTPAEDTTLYAKWLEIFTVAYNSNGGSELETERVTEGQSVDAPEAPAKADYVFGGWFDNEELEGEAVEFPYTPAASVILYAKWLCTYTVSYNLNNYGSAAKADDTVAEGGSITLASPSRKGFTFGGWYDNEELNGEAVATEYSPAADVTLYAKWVAQTEYQLEKGDYGTVNKNRGAWYYNLQGTQASATINSSTYDNGTISFAVSGAKKQTSVGSNAIQLRYLPDFAGGETYTAIVKVTVSMGGIIKLAPDNKGQSQTISADVETVLTFTGTVEWNDADKLYRPLLIQFYPAEEGDVNIAVTIISIALPDSDLYSIQYGYNSGVCADPGTWYHWEADNAKSSVASAIYNHGTITVSLNNTVSTDYNFRYQPEAFVSEKSYNVTFRIKLSGGLKVSDSTVSGTGITISPEEDDEGFVTVTCSHTLKASNAFEFRFKGSSAVGTSVTITITDIEFTEL